MRHLQKEATWFLTIAIIGITTTAVVVALRIPAALLVAVLVLLSLVDFLGWRGIKREARADLLPVGPASAHRQSSGPRRSGFDADKPARIIARLILGLVIWPTFLVGLLLSCCGLLLLLDDKWTAALVLLAVGGLVEGLALTARFSRAATGGEGNRIPMNKAEAQQILAEQLRSFREKPYSELAELVGAVQTAEVTASSGSWYQLEFSFFWDNKPNGNIRVIGAIDDGGVRVFFPLGDDFIKAPDDSFVGE